MLPGKTTAQVPGGSIYLSADWPSDRSSTRSLSAGAPFVKTSFDTIDQFDGLQRHLSSQKPQQLFSIPQGPVWSPPDSTQGGRNSIFSVIPPPTSTSTSSTSSSTSTSSTSMSLAYNDIVDPTLLTRDVLREMRNASASGTDDEDDDGSKSSVESGSGIDVERPSFLSMMSPHEMQDPKLETYRNSQEWYISVLEDTIRSIQECVREAASSDYCRSPQDSLFEPQSQQFLFSQLYQRVESIIRSRPELSHLLLPASSDKFSHLLLPSQPIPDLSKSTSPALMSNPSLPLTSPLTGLAGTPPLRGSSTSPPGIKIFNPVGSVSSPGQQAQPIMMPSSTVFLQPSVVNPESTSTTKEAPQPNSGGSSNPLLFASPVMSTVESSRPLFVASAPVFVPHSLSTDKLMPRGESPSSHSPKRRGINSINGSMPGGPSQQAAGMISLEDISEPEDVKGHVVALTQYQAGCRYLQKQLDALDGPRKQQFVQIVFNEVLPVLPQVITDTYGQYLIPKLMEHSNDAQRCAMITKLAPEMKHIACHSFGSHGLQRSLQYLQDDQVQLLGSALNQHVSALCKDQKGNYLIQCFVKIFGPGSRVDFIFQLLTSELVSIAKHKVGCTVICRCLENADDKQTSAIVNKVLANALPFARDEYANYVVQHIILHCAKQYSSALINAFRGYAKELCQQKFGSNVMEKCLESSDREQFDDFLAELTSDDFLHTILSDQYGNFVLQKLLDLCTKEQHASLVERILPILHSSHSPFAVHIEKKLKK